MATHKLRDRKIERKKKREREKERERKKCHQSHFFYTQVRARNAGGGRNAPEDPNCLLEGW